MNQPQTIKACTGCQEYYTYTYKSLDVLVYDRDGQLWCYECVKNGKD